MSIEYDDKLRPVVTIGDGDVLIGGTAAPGLIRFWMAPRKDADGLVTNEVTPAPDGCPPPGNEVVTVFFVSKVAIDGFIDMLTKTRDKAFPPPPVGEQSVRVLTPEQFATGWDEYVGGVAGYVRRPWTEADVLGRDRYGYYIVREPEQKKNPPL